ncbi:helix-turn-helix domain-containing protein [Niallia sp. JL1B1071]|uniref:helix-turn-helix domain-containing protein n=1 Tax=Niallia tiangongensis TaxID=3237105 RepID=UPI0037DD4674
MENRLNMKNLEYVCNIMKDILNVSITILDNEGTIITEIPANELCNPLYPSKQSFYRQVLSSNRKKNHDPIIRSTTYYENVSIIQFANLGTIILGPVLSSRPTRVLIDELISTHGRKEMEDTLSDYYYSLPVISNAKLGQVCKLFYFLYNNKIYDNEIAFPKIQSPNHVIDEKIANKYMLEIHQDSSFHHDPIAEKKIYQFIIDGQKENLLAYWKAFKENTSFDFGKLSKKNEVRNQKNLSIATITLATRAAITGGLHPEIAYTLGDRFIQDLEELQDLKDIHLFTENILYEFADKVAKTKRENYSRPIFQCRNYIYKHIYEPLTLQSIAEHLSISPKYLSNLFKQEVGMPISEYIQQTKIEEAKKLMTFAEHSLSDIHALLNFTDQSYFTKVFKKYTGITPKEFRKKSVDFL